MSPYSIAGKNFMLDALVGVSGVTHVSLHTAVPDDLGSNEVSGGTYARIAIAHGTPAAGGSIAHDGVDPVFNVPASTEVFYLGFWDALTLGTFLGYVPINGGAVDGVASVANVGDLFTAPAHGLVNTDRVTLKGPVGETLPAGLSETVIYFVVGATATTFQVSLTSGGVAVDPAADGQAYFQKVIPESFGAAGTLTVDTSTLKLEE